MLATASARNANHHANPGGSAILRPARCCLTSANAMTGAIARKISTPRPSAHQTG
jgi:hypothetical protein